MSASHNTKAKRVRGGMSSDRDGRLKVCFSIASALQDGAPPSYPYLLRRSLEAFDVEVDDKPFSFYKDWLRAHQGRVQVLHFHWIWSLNYSTLRKRLHRLRIFILGLIRARTLGYKVIWTVHNLFAHENKHPVLDYLMRFAIAQLSTSIIVHCAYAKGVVARYFFRKRNVFVIPHGHWLGSYRNDVSSVEARRRLGLPEKSFVYLFFGYIRPYKGLTQLMEAFSQVEGDELRLLIAGRGVDRSAEQVVADLARLDERVILHIGLVPNELVQHYVNAADVVVLPFTSILTSGSLILAMGFRKPVIAPAVGCIPEVADDGMGILYNPKAPGALQAAMEEIRWRDLESTGRRAYQKALSLDWQKIGQMTLDVYQRPWGTPNI